MNNSKETVVPVSGEVKHENLVSNELGRVNFCSKKITKQTFRPLAPGQGK